MESGDGEGAGGCVLADLASLLNCTGCAGSCGLGKITPKVSCKAGTATYVLSFQSSPFTHLWCACVLKVPY